MKGTCGHELDTSFQDAYALVKDYITDDEGIHRCVKTALLCKKCKTSYGRGRHLLKTLGDEEKWLDGK